MAPDDISSILIKLRSFDRMKAAAAFGGLLVEPTLQSNCHRIEALVHMAVRFASGQKKPSRQFVEEAFNALGKGMIGRGEDPAEDVFVSSMINRNGNFRVFTGIFEGAGFYLQQFIDLCESMPDQSPFDAMLDSVNAMLRLSEAVARRAGIERNSLGGDSPLETIPEETLKDLGRLRAWVTFDDEDLSRIGVKRKDLSPFVFSPEQRELLDGYTPGNSPLEKRPILSDRNSIVLALPTAVSVALRCFVIDQCRKHKLDDTLILNLGQTYTGVLRRLPSFGGPHVFRRRDGFLISNTLEMIDQGRWIHTLAFVDDFNGYAVDGLIGFQPNIEQLASLLSVQIEEWSNKAKTQSGFRSGLTILVPCGWGRGFLLPNLNAQIDKWSVEAIPIHDLDVMAKLAEYGPCELWKTLNMRDEIERLGVEVLNVSGVLNLVAWEQRLEGHHVSHPDLPERFIEPGSKALYAIPTNQIRDLRHEVARSLDFIKLNYKGELLLVCRTGGPLVPEDEEIKIYGAFEEAGRGRLIGVYPSNQRNWWLEVKGAGPKSIVFKYWEMLLHWMAKVACTLESRLHNLPKDSISWIVDLGEVSEAVLASSIVIPEAPQSLYSCLNSDIDRARSEIRLQIKEPFHTAFYCPENLAEKMLVRAYIEAIFRICLKAVDDSQIELVVNEVITNPDARHIHMGHEQGFRDRLRTQIPAHPLIISKQDNAMVRLSRSNAETNSVPPIIMGIEACTEFLNGTVIRLENELCHLIKDFNRESFIHKVMTNHEAAAVEQAHWRKTASAILGLRTDKQDAMRVIVEQEGSRNAVTLTSRILIEAAACECQEKGGLDPGMMDLATSMAIASSIFQLGGMSDAIFRGIKEPELHISPLGDIMSKPIFEDEVLRPFGQAGTKKQVTHAISKYSDHYQIPNGIPSIEGLFEADFVSAWASEFGFSIDDGRRAIDHIEDEGEQKNAAVFFLRESSLGQILSEAGLGSATAMSFIRSMSLPARNSWKEIPDGYLPRDREPWRFRRRLSMMRRPLVQMDLSENPELMIAPGFLRDAYLYILRGFYEGSFPVQNYAGSEAMRSWIGRTSHLRGVAFNKEVQARMEELGWKTRCELKVTELLGIGFGTKNYGDIDVLAWNESTGRTLVMECKDLNFSKTPGEVADQLTEFLGERGEGNRRDSLGKHLDRFDLLSHHKERVGKFIGSTASPKLESHLVFRHPVPMVYAWEARQSQAQLSLFDDLHEL